MTEAFQRGFIKAALDNGLNLPTAYNMLKQSAPTPPAPNPAAALKGPLSQIAGDAGMLGSGGSTAGAMLGAPAGALLGGGLGAGLGYMTGDEDTKWRNAAIGGGLGSMPGAAAGAGLGGGLGAEQSQQYIQELLQKAMAQAGQ